MSQSSVRISLLRNLYAGQEATVRTGQGTTDWFQIGKGVCQDCILSPCLFNLYAEYIMRNTGLEEAQAGIKLARRNNNNLRYAAAAAAAAKSHQSCLTLCDPRDGSPPGSSVPGILQARTLEWAAISFSKAWKWKVKVKVKLCLTLRDPMTASYQAPPSMGFPRQE